MRKDVKIGLVMSLILVVLAGWYYGRPTDEPAAIQLDDAQTMAKRLAEKQPAKVESVPPPKPKSILNSTNADRSGPPPAKQEAQQEAFAKRSSDQQDYQIQTHLADSNLAGSASERPAPRTNATPDETDQLGMLDRLVQKKSGAMERSARSDGVASQTEPVSINAADDVMTDDGAMERHRVRPGDTLAKVAEIYYGDDKRVSVLAKANPELPITGALPENMMVRIPALEDNEHDFSDRDIASAPESLARGKLASDPSTERSKQVAPHDSRTLRTYQVQDGDSFYTIAVKELGEASRWPELYDINKEIVGNDPNRLRAGLVLKIPANQ